MLHIKKKIVLLYAPFYSGLELAFQLFFCIIYEINYINKRCHIHQLHHVN